MDRTKVNCMASYSFCSSITNYIIIIIAIAIVNISYCISGCKPVQATEFLEVYE